MAVGEVWESKEGLGLRPHHPVLGRAHGDVLRSSAILTRHQKDSLMPAKACLSLHLFRWEESFWSFGDGVLVVELAKKACEGA